MLSITTLLAILTYKMHRQLDQTDSFAIVQRLWPRNIALATSWLILSQDMQQALVLYICCFQLVLYVRKAPGQPGITLGFSLN